MKNLNIERSRFLGTLTGKITRWFFPVTRTLYVHPLRANPLRTRMDYNAMGRKTFLVLPEGTEMPG